MNATERRREVADLASDIDIIENTMVLLDSIMENMVGDDVDSEYGEIMFLWNKKSSVYVKDSYPIMMPQQEDEPDENAQIVGVNLIFQTPLKYNHMHSGIAGISNKLMLRAMSRLKTDLRKEQGLFEKKLSSLVKV